ncbi:MAG: hypothetical protein AB1Z19_03335 [Eubacteriales bacterium]
MKKKWIFVGLMIVMVLTIMGGVHLTAEAAPGDQLSIEATFWADREYIWEGEYIGLRFKFVNTGSVTISGLTVRDSSIAGGAWLNSPISLAPGETRIVTYNLALNHDLDLSPGAQYSAGGSTHTISFPSKRLYVIDDDVSVVLESSTTTPAAGEEVTFIVRLRNNGNVPLRNLKLYNHNNELVPLKGTQLYSGNSVSVETTATFKESDSVQFDITATDAYGTVYSHASNTIEIRVPIDFDIGDLSVKADPEYNKLSVPGPATFDILLTNNSEYSLYDISVKDLGTGEVVAEMTNMEKGERLVRVTTPVEETREVVFEVMVHDADGKAFTLNTQDDSTIVTILSQEKEEAAAAEASEAAALATPSPSPTAAPKGGLKDMSTWVLAVIGFGVGILVVIIILSVLIAAQKKQGGGGGTPDPAGGMEPAKAKKPKKKKKKKTKELKGSSMPPVKPVPKKRPSGPKKKGKTKKHKGPIRVSYRDHKSF